MFRRLSEPLPLSEASLLALRPALNAPVLNVDFLPVGPAKAAIVVFAEEWGGIGLALGIRSNEGGQVAVLGNQEPIDASTPISEAIEPVLATAERMGFLFDEDLVEGATGDRGQAMELWGRLMGEVDLTLESEEPILDLSEPLDSDFPDDDLDDADFDLDELVEVPLEEIPLDLTDPIADDLDPRESTTAKSAPVTAAKPAPVPEVTTLSKFRHSAVGGDRKDAKATGGSELARIPLVRVRRERESGPKRVSYLARLLSNF